MRSKFKGIRWMCYGVGEDRFLKRGVGTWMGDNNIVGHGYCVGVVKGLRN